MARPQGVPVNFSQGLDQKTDPKQVQAGKFLALKNTIFQKGGLLQKRNGFGRLASLPDTTYNFVSTLNDDLTAIGPNIAAYNVNNGQWVPKGSFQPLTLNTLPLVRNNFNQISADTVISNGLALTAYTETDGTNYFYRYVIADAVTGQNIVAPTLLAGSTGTQIVGGSPRVFVVSGYFVIIFTRVITATAHLQYIGIPIVNLTAPTTAQDIASSYIPASTVSWDAAVYGNNIWVAYNATAGGQSVKVTFLTKNQIAGGSTPSTTAVFAGEIATMMSVAIDSSSPTNPVIYCSYYDLASTDGFTLSVLADLTVNQAPQPIIAAQTVENITSVADAGICTVYYEILNMGGLNSDLPANYIDSVSVSGMVVSTAYTVIRSVGLASKAFILNGAIYVLTAYQSPFQPTCFLIKASESTQESPVITAKLAYENGGGYVTLGLPGVTVDSDTVQFPYFFKDLIEALNTLNNSTQTTTGGIYSQTGINLGTIEFNNSIDSAEIASNLHLGGGFFWHYDGFIPIEHNFFLWPEAVEATGSAGGGSMTAQQYYYQAVYEWSDNQGNRYMSAPSVPTTVTLMSTGHVTLSVPTLRLTYKIDNPVKITLYRWSAANQVYYQVTSITSPILNDTTVDDITFTDTLADTSIIGNNIIYTTGGVVEDINAPATNIMTLFDTRLWLVDAEDQNLLWFSKQVIEATPVEMSDLFTRFIPPTTASQGTTGPISALAPMDDKLIIFKKNALYYINGAGPDNAGANNQYSEPIFINSTVGCSNQQSIVFTPAGLMFQSDKGIWLLGRDLSTQYIGAAVEDFNGSLVQSAVNIPATNQVRFTLNSGEMLMFDYYYGQWGTFYGVPAISSCIYQGLHTFINKLGQVYQETPGAFLDGGTPVLISFVTSWLNLAGINGYQRIYEFIMTGSYISPHKLNVSVAYDFNPLSVSCQIAPSNFTEPWGSDSLWGQTSPWGGPGALEQWRVQVARQKCQVFQITVSETFDASFGTMAGAGFTMSAVNLVIGVNSTYRPIAGSKTVGAS
jgi:hypothetical protein